MGISIERNNLFSLEVVGRTLMQDLLDNGFNEVAGQINFTSSDVATFEADATVDPLAATQPWRLRVAISAAPGNITSFLDLHVGTATNLPDDLSVISNGLPNSVNHDFESTGHLIGIEAPFEDYNEQQLYSFHAHQIYNNPIDYQNNQLASVASRPMSYRLSISDRGVAFCLWAEGFESEGDMFMWFVIQRPVDNQTGSVLSTGRCPVFCLFSSGGGFPYAQSVTNPDACNIYQMVVRESDIYRPYGFANAGAHNITNNREHHAVLNPMQQVGIAENNQFVITFPNKFNTTRHLYKHELDMVAYTSADVISQFSDIDVTVYGEGTPRTYTALNANMPLNTGMRLLFLTASGGI